jgi:mRNA interferase MazF
MNAPTAIYEQFDVVVVPFPFTDINATKRRPALILSDAIPEGIPLRIAFNTAIGRSVMAMITTATHSSWLLDVRITNLQAAGLKTPSIVRMKLFTLEHSLIVKRIGKLTVTDRGSVKKALKQLFKLN